jgi:serine/threonine protein kinase
MISKDRGARKRVSSMPYRPDFQGKQIKQYRLQRSLGVGGFAAVYLAEDTLQHTLVAIKILFTRLDTANIATFISESKVVFLDHPHIVRIRDFDVSPDGYPYFVMEYLERGNLRQRHAAGMSLPWQTVAAYARQVAQALDYVHEKGLVHRDVKPENILIGNDDRLQLGDFGIAVVSYTVNLHRQTPYGTQKYIAPEQINGEAVRASDQYALGAMMYEWLTGKLPFDGTPNEVFIKHLQVPPVPLRQKNPTLTPEIEALVLKMLEKKPEQRFASMQEFLVAMERIVVEPVVPPQVWRDEFSREQEGAVLALAWSPDGRFMASAGQDMAVQVWEVATGKGSSQYKHGGEIQSVKWSPDSRLLASAGTDEIVHVWEAATGKELVSYAAHEGSIHEVAWSPNGLKIASAGDDSVVQVWDLLSANLLLTYEQHDKSVLALAWSPNGRYLASAGSDCVVRVWEAATGGYLCLYHGHSDPVTALAWSPDGTSIASSSDDGTLHLWHASTGKPVHIYKAHEQAISALAWSPDGLYLASSSWDKTVCIWDVTKPAVCLYRYTQHTHWVNGVVWSPDGRYLASASWDKTVRIFTPPYAST